MHPSFLIIDSSVIIKWLSEDHEEDLESANKILRDAQLGKVELVAPELAKYEVGNVLLFSKKLSSEEGADVLSQFFNLPITYIPESEIQAVETYALAFDLGITYYDAAFLSLAKQYDAPLVTSNLKHQGKPSSIRVIPLQSY